MNEELIKNADACYALAEQKAADYFKSLHEMVSQKIYIPALTTDSQSWKQNHIHHYSLFSLLSGEKRKPDPERYHDYLHWLDYQGKLDHYLDRSISYIFMRDLGKALDSPETQTKVRRTVESLKDQLITKGGEPTIGFSMAGLYRFGQKIGIESAIIWLIDKLIAVASLIPRGMDALNAQRKLIKIIAGVLMHEMEAMGGEITPKERSRKLDQAIRLGYSYGLTYPFIDDLLDANVLSKVEKKQYSDLIRTALITGSVPEWGGWKGENPDWFRSVHSELRKAFEYIKSHQQSETRQKFFEQAYVFFHSQEIDRTKDLANADYSNEEIYLPLIIKSAFSRLIARSVISAPDDEGFDKRTFFYGIYNQLADDFADMFADLKDGAVTPYTYYLRYHDQRSDLINPYELYWTVIANLIDNVYHSDPKTREVILDRAINGLKRFKERNGTEKYNEVMELFASGDPKFNRLIQKMVRKGDDVDFFDKLIRDHILIILKKERKDREAFLETAETVRSQINQLLRIQKLESSPLMNEIVIDAANYSLEGDGKRLRPIMTWVMGVNGYGLDESKIVPLVKSLEYMHTASLIFDDLPSQDNSPIRRGRPTLHQVYNMAIAELTGLFLTQKAMEELASLDTFDAQTVLNLIQYSAQTTQRMCTGQAMDLDSKGKTLTLEQLNTLCFYKTGLAFEASLIGPAILAHANEAEVAALKKFACHAGIAFQIKDDLLDVEGDMKLLGKPVGKDAENSHSTFVSILGPEGAGKQMWDHYCLAMEALQEMPRNTTFLKHLLNYIVHRDH